MICYKTSSSCRSPYCLHRVSDMKSKLAIAVLLLIVVVPASALPASTPDAKAETAIRAVLDAQAAAHVWAHSDVYNSIDGICLCEHISPRFGAAAYSA